MGTGRWPIPIFVGELGVDNAAPRLDRMLWLSWVRMASEGFGFSWAHWNMYESSNSSKGMGPWTDAEKWNPDLRRFDADPLEALIGRYHFSQPATAASPARVDSVLLPRAGHYLLSLRYSCDVDMEVSITHSAVAGSHIVQLVATGGSWAVTAQNIASYGGEDVTLEISHTQPSHELRLDWAWYTLINLAAPVSPSLPPLPPQLPALPPGVCALPAKCTLSAEQFGMLCTCRYEWTGHNACPGVRMECR